MNALGILIVLMAITSVLCSKSPSEFENENDEYDYCADCDVEADDQEWDMVESPSPNEGAQGSEFDSFFTAINHSRVFEPNFSGSESKYTEPREVHSEGDEPESIEHELSASSDDEIDAVIMSEDNTFLKPFLSADSIFILIDRILYFINPEDGVFETNRAFPEYLSNVLSKQASRDSDYVYFSLMYSNTIHKMNVSAENIIDTCFKPSGQSSFCFDQHDGIYDLKVDMSKYVNIEYFNFESLISKTIRIQTNCPEKYQIIPLMMSNNGSKLFYTCKSPSSWAYNSIMYIQDLERPEDNAKPLFMIESSDFFNISLDDKYAVVIKSEKRKPMLFNISKEVPESFDLPLDQSLIDLKSISFSNDGKKMFILTVNRNSHDIHEKFKLIEVDFEILTPMIDDVSTFSEEGALEAFSLPKPITVNVQTLQCHREIDDLESIIN